jgi:cytochrome c-type biogenesis protein CcmH
MIAFWVAAALLSAAAIALVVYFAGREPQSARVDPAAAVYRRQLDEIDELADRGLLAEDERKSAHAEAARRLLGAGEMTAEAPPTKGMRLAVIFGGVAAAVAAMGVYMIVGAPGQPDLPFKARAAQWTALAKGDPGQLDPERLAVVLKDMAAQRPNDPLPIYYLAVAELQSGQVQLGIHNLKKAAALAPDQAQIWATLGEALTLAQTDGTVTPEASAAFQKAVQLDPKAVRPRFYLGQAKIEAGDKAGGLAAWKALAAEQPAGAPERKAIETEIARIETGGGAAKPAADNPQAAMIQGMVASLADKLKKDPNDVAGWSRLIRSYAVLGDTAKMNAALEEARRIFKDKPSERAQIESAADKPQ